MELTKYQKVFEGYVSEYNLFPRNAHIFFLISGGKDSTAMSYLIKEYTKKRKDLKIKHLNVVFPQMVFGLTTKEINATTDKISKGLKKFKSRIAETSYHELEPAQNPCLLCKQVRRKIISEMIAHEKNQCIIIATAHNNYDLLAYFTEFFGINTREMIEKGINYEQLHNIKLKDEQLEHFSYFFPKLELNSGVALIKPMLVFGRPEIEDILNKAGIPGFLEPCPYAKERAKRLLFNFLKTLPEDKVKDLTYHETFNEMISILKEKVENYNEALAKIKKTNYEELLL